jgi:hypothetical protein
MAKMNLDIQVEKTELWPFIHWDIQTVYNKSQQVPVLQSAVQEVGHTGM